MEEETVHFFHIEAVALPCDDLSGRDIQARRNATGLECMPTGFGSLAASCAVAATHQRATVEGQFIFVEKDHLFRRLLSQLLCSVDDRQFLVIVQIWGMHMSAPPFIADV